LPHANRAGAVHTQLRRLRRTYGWWLVESYLAWLAVVVAAAAGAALALTPVAGNALRAGLLGATVAASLATAWALRGRARPALSLVGFARYLQRALAGARQDFETALALEAQAYDDPVTGALALAHRDKAAAALRAVPPQVLRAPRRRAVEAAAVVAWCLLVAAAVALPERVSEARNAWLRWDGGAAQLPGGAARSVRVASEFTFRIQPPKYTGLEAETVTGAGLLLSAYKGSAVRAGVRLQAATPAARLALPGGAVVDLKPGDGGLTGEFVVTEKGPFTLQIKAAGGWVDDGIERAIDLVADLPPNVRIVAPNDGLTLNPRDELALRFEASDDFGFTQANLVVLADGAESRFALPVSGAGARFVAGKRFAVSELGPEGAALSYYVEVFDNDAVTGPKRGTSRPQKLDVYSPRKNHQALLEREQRLLVVLVHALADAIGLPEVFGAGVGPQLGALKRRLAGAVAEFSALSAALRTDPIADAAQTLTFEAIGARVEAQRDETAGYARSVSAGTGAERYAGFRPRAIEAGEEAVLDLAELLKQARMNDLLLTAGDLQRAREDLRRLIAEYRKNPKAETLAAMRAKVAEIKRLMNELAEKQIAANQTLPDEFLNADAFKKAQAANPASKLDDLEKLLNGDDPERALAEAEKFERSLNDMLASLEQAGQDASAQANTDSLQKLTQAIQELTELEQGQRKLAQAARAEAEKQSGLLLAASGGIKRKLAQELEKLSAEAKELHEKAVMSTLWNRGFSFYAPQADAEVRRAQQAVAGGDWPAARLNVERTEGYLRNMQTQADFEAQAGLGGGLTKELHMGSLQAADHAASIRKLLDNPGGLFAGSMESLEGAQAKLQERLQQTKKKLDPKNGATAPQQSRQALDGGEQAMGQAREKMRGNQAEAASMKADEAAEQLAQARKELEKAKRNMERGASGGQRSQGGGGPEGGFKEKVEIPHTSLNAEPRADRRGEVIKGMREGLPKAYQDLNKKYYDKLVK
jgi:hypothetical protein